MLRQGRRLIFRLEFGHHGPVSLGHMGHAALGIVPGFNGHRVIKPGPQFAVKLLPSVGFWQLQPLQRKDLAAASAA